MLLFYSISYWLPFKFFSQTQPGGFGFEILAEMEAGEINDNFRNSRLLNVKNEIIEKESTETPL